MRMLKGHSGQAYGPCWLHSCQQQGGGHCPVDSHEAQRSMSGDIRAGYMSCDAGFSRWVVIDEEESGVPQHPPDSSVSY